MTGRLADRVAVVTGGGNGLGRAYTQRLAAAGARVAVFDVDGAAAEASAADVSGRAFTVDVADPDQVRSAVAAVLREWGRIDALVNNAGGALFPSAPFDSFSLDQWTHVVGVNLTGPWVCAVAVAPAMRTAGYGKIVNVSSTTVSLGRPIGLAPYLAAKAGVVGLTRALARELGPHHVCVNAVAPGYVPVDTAKAVHSPEAAQALCEQMIAEQCLPRTEIPEDLCGTIEFLCSSDSDFVTGQVFNVDGGWAHN